MTAFTLKQIVQYFSLVDGSCLLNVKSRNSSSPFSLMSKVASHSTTLKPKQGFFSGKRLYCPCLSFSEAVTKESLGLSSREADEGEEEVRASALRVRVKNRSVTIFYTTIGPFFVPESSIKWLKVIAGPLPGPDLTGPALLLPTSPCGARGLSTHIAGARTHVRS